MKFLPWNQQFRKKNSFSVNLKEIEAYPLDLNLIPLGIGCTSRGSGPKGPEGSTWNPFQKKNNNKQSTKRV